MLNIDELIIIHIILNNQINKWSYMLCSVTLLLIRLCLNLLFFFQLLFVSYSG